MIVLGRDSHGVWRAAWFPKSEERLVRRAAAALEYEVVAVAAPADIEAAKKARPGQLYRTARLFAAAASAAVVATLSDLVAKPTDTAVQPPPADAEAPVSVTD